MKYFSFIITALIIVVLFIELIIEYALRTVMYIPWRLIKKNSIYSYPPLFVYTVDDIIKM